MVQAYTKQQIDTAMKLSGVQEECAALGGGTFKLERVGVNLTVRFYNQDGSYSHVVAAGAESYVNGVWEDIKHGRQ